MTLSISWLTSFMYITIRLGALIMLSPIGAIRNLPVHVRLLFLFSISALMNQIIGVYPAYDEMRLLIGALCEAANGLILCTSLYVCFSLFQMAGQLIENQIGLNTLAVFNPQAHQQEAVTSHLFSLLGVILFFGIDGHLWLFKGLAYSFMIIPPGTIELFRHPEALIQQFTLMFSMSVMLASPIIAVLLIIDLCGGIITRNMPQISPYFLTLPVKILLGFLLLGFTLDYLNPLSQQAFNLLFTTWKELMA